MFHTLYSEYFEVDSDSCILYVARQIDRDQVCNSASKSICRMTIDVALVRPVALFRALQVHVDVLDLNDNDPEFNVEHFVLTIPESVSPGAIIIRCFISVLLVRCCNDDDDNDV